MSDFREDLKYDRTNESKEDELEIKMLEHQIERATILLEQEMYMDIKKEKIIVEEIVKNFEKLKYYQSEEEFNNAEYEFQKRRLKTLTTKQLEFERRMQEDPSWAEFMQEELKGEHEEEGEERD